MDSKKRKYDDLENEEKEIPPDAQVEQNKQDLVSEKKKSIVEWIPFLINYDLKLNKRGKWSLDKSNVPTRFCIGGKELQKSNEKDQTPQMNDDKNVDKTIRKELKSIKNQKKDMAQSIIFGNKEKEKEKEEEEKTVSQAIQLNAKTISLVTSIEMHIVHNHGLLFGVVMNGIKQILNNCHLCMQMTLLIGRGVSDDFEKFQTVALFDHINDVWSGTFHESTIALKTAKTIQLSIDVGFLNASGGEMSMANKLWIDRTSKQSKADGAFQLVGGNLIPFHKCVVSVWTAVVDKMVAWPGSSPKKLSLQGENINPNENLSFIIQLNNIGEFGVDVILRYMYFNEHPLLDHLLSMKADTINDNKETTHYRMVYDTIMSIRQVCDYLFLNDLKRSIESLLPDLAIKDMHVMYLFNGWVSKDPLYVVLFQKLQRKMKPVLTDYLRWVASSTHIDLSSDENRSSSSSSSSTSINVDFKKETVDHRQIQSTRIPSITDTSISLKNTPTPSPSAGQKRLTPSESLVPASPSHPLPSTINGSLLSSSSSTSTSSSSSSPPEYLTKKQLTVTHTIGTVALEISGKPKPKKRAKFVVSRIIKT